MRVSVIIPFAGDCPHRHRALAWVISRLAVRHVDSELIVSLGEPGPWRKGAVIAEGLRRAHGDVVVLHDADVYCDELGRSIGAVAEGFPWSVPHVKVHRLDEAATDAVIAGAEPASTATRAERPYRGTIGGGIVVLRRDVIDEVPPDCRFEGWGQEDSSHAVALTTLAGVPRCFDGDLYHLWHPPAQRMTRRFGSRESRALYQRYRLARSKPDAMRTLLSEIEEATWPAPSPQ